MVHPRGARSSARDEWPELVANSLLALSGLAFVYYLAYRNPVGYIYLVDEDRWAEYGSFVSWAMACCLMGWVLVKQRALRTPGFFLFALAAFVLAMEEISWGQRILGVSTPEYFKSINSQRELNLHNLTLPGMNVYYRTFSVALLLWSVGLTFVAAKSAGVHRFCNRLGIPVVRVRLWPFFFLPVYFVFSRDLFGPLPETFEIAELYASIAIASLALDIALTSSRGPRTRGPAAVFATVGMLLIAGVLTGLLIWSFTSSRGMGAQMNEFAGKRYPRAGMPRQAEMVFEYIKKNPQFLTTETRIHEGEFLLETGRQEQAEEALLAALAGLEDLERQNPADVEPLRNEAKVLLLLGRRPEADRVIEEALALDQAQLEKAKDGEEEAMIHWSLAKTLFQQGDSAGALGQVATARERASRPRTRERIERWFTEAMEKESDLE